MIPLALSNLLDLPVGWDGYRAPPPSRRAVERLAQALDIAEARGLILNSLVPDVEGGVVAYFFGGARSPDGGWQRQTALMADNAGSLVLYLRDRAEYSGSFVEVPAAGEEPAVEIILSYLREGG